MRSEVRIYFRNYEIKFVFWLIAKRWGPTRAPDLQTSSRLTLTGSAQVW